ncbi:MAG: class IV adenylate cyclase [Pseudonocardiales bacterium]
MSVIEVERKRELIDTCTAVEARLAELGYREHGCFVEVDTYYSRPEVDYLDTVECLRVRQRDGFAEITYKPASEPSTHSPDDVISKRETNVALSGADQAEAANHLLTAIGMTRLVLVEKSRALYHHPDRDDITVSLDTVSGVGTFIETEVTAVNADGATALLEQVEHQLGLTAHPVVTMPYRDLVLRRDQPIDEKLP